MKIKKILELLKERKVTRKELYDIYGWWTTGLIQALQKQWYHIKPEYDEFNTVISYELKWYKPTFSSVVKALRWEDKHLQDNVIDYYLSLK